MLILPGCTFIQKTADYRRCPRDPGGITFWRPCLEVAGIVITPIWFWIPALYYSLVTTQNASDILQFIGFFGFLSHLDMQMLQYNLLLQLV